MTQRRQQFHGAFCDHVKNLGLQKEYILQCRSLAALCLVRSVQSRVELLNIGRKQAAWGGHRQSGGTTNIRDRGNMVRVATGEGGRGEGGDIPSLGTPAAAHAS